MMSGKDTVGRIWQYLASDPRNRLFNMLEEWVKPGGESYKAKESGWEIRKFAGKVKIIVSMLTGISVEDLEKEEVKEMELGNEWMVRRAPNPLAGPKGADAHYDYFYSPLTVREILQKVGTDCMRKHLHLNVWVNALLADYKPIGQTVQEYGSQVLREDVYPNWLITDVRFPNEAKAIKDMGGILIRVERPDNPSRIKPWQFRSLHESETALDSYQDWDYTVRNEGSIDDLIINVTSIYNDYTKRSDYR